MGILGTIDNDTILVKEISQEKKSEGGLIITEGNTQPELIRALVLCGEGVPGKGENSGIEIYDGDIVYFPRLCSREGPHHRGYWNITLEDGTACIIVHITEIVAIESADPIGNEDENESTD